MTKRVSKSYPQTFKDSIVQKIRSGERVKVVADKSGVHYSLVYAWMKKAGVAPAKKAKVVTDKFKHSTESFKLEDAAKTDMVRDAIIYLKHARREILKGSSTGSLSRSNLLTLLALDTLEGR